jgi:hypothetical protein
VAITAKASLLAVFVAIVRAIILENLKKCNPPNIKDKPPQRDGLTDLIDSVGRSNLTQKQNTK